MAGSARPTPKRRPTGAGHLRHKRTCHEAQYPGGARGVFAPDVAALNTVPDAGSTVHVEGTVPRMPPWGSPPTGQSLGHGRALPPALTNTVPDAGSTVPSCQPTACRCAPADLPGPHSRAQRAMLCMPGDRVPCQCNKADATRIGGCYRRAGGSWRSSAVVHPCFDLCVRGLAVRRIVAPGAVRGAGAALDTRPLQGATVEELRLPADG